MFEIYSTLLEYHFAPDEFFTFQSDEISSFDDRDFLVGDPAFGHFVNGQQGPSRRIEKSLPLASHRDLFSEFLFGYSF